MADRTAQEDHAIAECAVRAARRFVEVGDVGAGMERAAAYYARAVAEGVEMTLKQIGAWDVAFPKEEKNDAVG